MTLSQNAEAAQRSEPPTGKKKKRKPLAERIVQALREAGYSCELADEAYSLNRVDLRSRH